ncbi:MAG: cation:proton antiporter [Bacteroides sp.]|nr:cation:proton antiporter [Prevotella sp.]MCM1408008.1 cation:proton antiporter [Treponema brennaborense]MCM1468984.1 cation:proton antiporter [Bacteroides sp.]
MDILADFFPDFMHFGKFEDTNLILLLGIILFLGAVGGRLFQKMKIPQVVGYIVIGIVIGQSGFQILSADVIAALNPLSSVALSLIGFLIGSELKIQVIRKYGRQFAGILLFEAIVPFFVVSAAVSAAAWLMTKNFAVSVSLGLVLGSISSATAPAATTDVLRENRTRGPLTSTVLGIVAMDDAVALVLYAAASSAATALLGSTAGSFGQQALALVYDIVVSAALGSAAGFLLSFVIRNVMTDEGRILAFSLGTLFLSTGICSRFNLDTILSAMSMGFFLVNFAPAKTRATFSLVEKFTPPIYVLFFVLVGAKLNIWNVTAFVGIIVLLYIVCRTLGKSIGSRIGAKITHAPETVRRYLPFCLLSQAGVAIGLSITAGQDFSSTIGATVILIITATTFVVQLLGPVCVKYAVTKAGECNLDICEEDIMKTCAVRDITCGGLPVCSEDSPAVVAETEKLCDILDAFIHHQNLNYCVKNAEGKPAGIITLEHLKESLSLPDFSNALMAMDIAEPSSVSVTPDMMICDVLKLFTEKDIDAAPILNENGKAAGILERQMIEHYLRRKVVSLHKKLSELTEQSAAE